MRFFIPVQNDKDGLKQKVNIHFGDSPYFVIYDSETKEHYFLANNNKIGGNGVCSVINLLKPNRIDCVILNNIGHNAWLKLKNLNIKVFRASNKIIEEMIDDIVNGKLLEVDYNNFDFFCGHVIHHGSYCHGNH